MTLHDDPRAHRGVLTTAVLGLGLLWLLKAVAALAVPIFAALLMVLLLGSVTEALQRRGVPAVLAAAIAVFVPALVLSALILATTPALGHWLQDLQRALTGLAGTLRPVVGDGVAASLLQWLAALRWRADAEASLARGAGPAALTLASILMLAFFLLWAQRSLLAGLLRAAPDARAQVRLLGALRDARRGAGSYLATMSWINLGLALVTVAGLAALGMPNLPAWIAVITVLLYVPYLGPAAIALMLAASAPGRTPLAVIAPPLLFLGLHAIEAQFVSPWWMGRRLRVGRPALLLAVMTGGWAWGIAGGVLAVPLLVAGQALLARRPGLRVVKALLAGEAAGAPSLADISARVLENGCSRASLVEPAVRVRRLPTLIDTTAACASPTLPKPMPPRSTVSR